jgi:hypothetical protein
LDVELIHKLGQDNVVSNALSRKEEFQVEKPLTKLQTLRAIVQGEKLIRKEDRGSVCARPIRSTPF